MLPFPAGAHRTAVAGGVVSAPVAEGVQYGQQGRAFLGQLIFHPRRHFGVGSTLDEPGRRQLAQLPVQHLSANAFQQRQQVAGTLRAAAQVVDNQALVLATHQLHGQVNGGNLLHLNRCRG